MICLINSQKIYINFEIYFTDSICKLFSAVVSRQWDPDSTQKHNERLESYECFSSWHKRNDISGYLDVTSAPKLREGFENFYAIDGFYCMENSDFMYHSNMRNGGGWLQLDLQGYFSLKCIRIPVRDKDGLMQEIEIRFGNESKFENFEKNPIIIEKTESWLGGTILEYCLERHLIGKYILLQEKKSKDDFILVGEIQVLVK